MSGAPAGRAATTLKRSAPGTGSGRLAEDPDPARAPSRPRRAAGRQGAAKGMAAARGAGLRDRGRSWVGEGPEPGSGRGERGD